MSETFVWSEIYRPHTIAACILPERLKQTFQEYVNKGEVPNLLLSGTAGVGKTTVAKAMCEEIGCDHLIINGSEENGIDTLRTKIAGYASSVSLFGGKKVIIVDEADGMNPNTLQKGLKAAIEEFITNCTFIFTCNQKRQIIEPIHSRCATIDFVLNKDEKADMAKQLMDRVCTILIQEEITFKKPVVAALIMKYFPDYRKTINELQRYSATGTIDEGILAGILDVDINDLITYLKAKDYIKVNKWTKTNTDNDPGRIFARIYESVNQYLKPATIPEIIVILAKYQFQAAFCANPELNLLACLVEIMVTGEFV